MNTILLLHGALGAKTQLEPLKRKLEESGRVAYVMNFSGHGGEAFRSTFGIETFVGDVLRFTEQIHIPKVDIYGYSMGGTLRCGLLSNIPIVLAE